MALWCCNAQLVAKHHDIKLEFCLSFCLNFWQQQAVLRKTLHSPTPKNVQHTFVLHTQNSTTFVLHTQNSTPKSRPKKGSKKHAKKAHCHLHNTHANRQKKKNFLKHIPEPVLLLSWNRSCFCQKDVVCSLYLNNSFFQSSRQRFPSKRKKHFLID